MQARFTAFAGFLATATLLSGSAFAFAPEFSGDLPTVIITDKLATAGPNNYDNNGVGAASTEYTMRFSDAFDLGAYVTPNTGNTAATVRYLFNEFNDENSATPNDRNVGTLLLNGNRAFASGATTIPAAGDFGSAPTVASASSLDFRNRDFSGDNEAINAGFDAIGDITGDSLLSGPQERLVQLYIKADADAGIDTANFLVITTTAGTDEVTNPVASDAFQNLIYPASGNGLSGWAAGAYGQLDLPQSPGDGYTAFGTAATITGYSNAVLPAATVAFNSATRTAVGTTQLTVTGVSSQVGFANWSLPFNEVTANQLSLQPNKLYRLRANIYSPSATSKEQVRLSFGDQFRSGLFTVSYSDTSAPAFVNGPAVMGTATTNFINIYGITKGASPRAGITLDIVTLGTALNGANASGQDAVLKSVVVAEADVADLGTGTVRLDLGSAVAPAGGEIRVPPASAPTTFLGSGVAAFSAGQLNTNQVTVRTVTAGSAAITFNTSALATNPPDFVNFANAGNGVNATAPGLFTVDNTKIYVVDVWASSSTAGNVYPDIRSSVSVAASYNAFSTNVVDKVLPAFLGGGASPLAIGTSPRAYSIVFKADNTPATAPANISILLQSFSKKYTVNTTVTINRITVTEYNNPSAN